MLGLTLPSAKVTAQLLPPEGLVLILPPPQVTPRLLRRGSQGIPQTQEVLTVIRTMPAHLLLCVKFGRNSRAGTWLGEHIPELPHHLTSATA